MFFHVINHFQPEGAGRHIAASTLFSAALARESDKVARVLVVDGSPSSDPLFAERVRELGADYAHAGRELTFSEGYNLGLERSNQPWTILSASDLYPSPDLFDGLARICGDPPDPRIGCVVPLLNRVDLQLQAIGRDQLSGPVRLPLMTLNLNAFPTEYLRSIGGVPGEFSGNYNDVLLSHRIARDGRDILLAPHQCLHFGSLTLKSGKSNVSLERDLGHFKAAFPELYREGSFWHVELSRFTRDVRLRLLAAAVRLLPARRRWRDTEVGMQRILRPGS